MRNISYLNFYLVVSPEKKKIRRQQANHHSHGKKADRASDRCHLPRDTQPLVHWKYVTPSCLIWTGFAQAETNLHTEGVRICGCAKGPKRDGQRRPLKQ